MPLGAIDEDRDRQKIGANRKLPAGEDRAGRDGKLMRASLALPKLARLILIGGIAFAARANGLAPSGLAGRRRGLPRQTFERRSPGLANVRQVKGGSAETFERQRFQLTLFISVECVGVNKNRCRWRTLLLSGEHDA
jgi:hypothetical protein